MRTTFENFFQNSSPAVNQFCATGNGQHEMVFFFQVPDAQFRLSDKAYKIVFLFVDVRNAFNCKKKVYY